MNFTGFMDIIRSEQNIDNTIDNLTILGDADRFWESYKEFIFSYSEFPNN